MKKFISMITVLTLVLSMGTTGFALDKVKEADKLYKQALKIEKTKPKDAIKLLDKAISYNPKNPEYYYKRGWLEPNYGKVIPDYNKAVVLNPDKYFDKCYGIAIENNKYVFNFNSMTLSAKSWVDVSDGFADLKKYLSTYKGDRVKNAQTIMGDSVHMITFASENEDAWATFSMHSDLKNEIANNESLAQEFAVWAKGQSILSDITEVKSSKLGNMDCAYVDYKETDTDGSVYTKRTYTMAFDYYAIVINVGATSDAAFKDATETFLGTFELK